MRGLERTWIAVRRCAIVSLAGAGFCALLAMGEARGQWGGYGRNAQHTGLTPGPSQLPLAIRWQMQVDLNPQYSGSDLLIHFGSPAITSANNIIVPVKTGASGSFIVKGINATTGVPFWTMSTDYVLPPHNWTPPVGVTLTPNDQAVVVAGAGGTVWVRKNPNAANGTASRVAFYGVSYFNQNSTAFGNAIQICTPITVDHVGNLYFGYLSSGEALPGYPHGIPSGLAKVGVDGSGGMFVAASALAGDGNIRKVVYNCAPATVDRSDQGVRGGEPEQLFVWIFDAWRRLKLCGRSGACF